ncbi:MAG: DUF4360 domain-containing protein [Proteobacteria bacterium]|nr:DUF4360 domain-containing protein [Pseudomonadota bacterium]
MMNRLLLASFTSLILITSACGTKKDEKNSDEYRDDSSIVVSRPGQYPDNDYGDGYNGNGSGYGNNPLQNEECPNDTDSMSIHKLYVKSQNSWLNPRYNNRNQFIGADGTCVDRVYSRPMNTSNYSALDLAVRHLELGSQNRTYGRSARCLTELKLAYRPGYAFGIRKVSAPLYVNTSSGSTGYFKGTYNFYGNRALVVEHSMDSRFNGRAIRVEHRVSDRNIQWSNCSGQSTLVIDTALGMSFRDQHNGNWGNQSEMRLDTRTPYRLELVWAKCNY